MGARFAQRREGDLAPISTFKLKAATVWGGRLAPNGFLPIEANLPSLVVIALFDVDAGPVDAKSGYRSCDLAIGIGLVPIGNALGGKIWSVETITEASLNVPFCNMATTSPHGKVICA